MSTIVSGTSPYCTLTRLLEITDWRTFADLLAETGTPVAGQTRQYAPLTLVQLQAMTTQGTPLYDYLMVASGLVEGAVAVHGRYTPADLAAIRDAIPPTNAALLLAQITAGLVILLAWERRPARLKDMPLPLIAEMAAKFLDDLREGTRIFAIQEVMDAGNDPEPSFMSENDLQTKNPLSIKARGFFGSRGQDSDAARG